MKTSEISYRPHNEDILNKRVEWLNNPLIAKWIYGVESKKTNLVQQKKWFLNYKKDKTKKFFTIFADDIPIGIIGLKNIDRDKKNAEIFIMIGEGKFRNKGIGKLALNYISNFANKLKLETLYLSANKDNQQAIRSFLSAGFNPEEIKRDEINMIKNLKTNRARYQL